MKKLILTVLVLIPALLVAQSYPLPEYLSVKDLAEWAQRGGFIASGTGDPTLSAPEGALYVDFTTPEEPMLWRRGASDWALIAGGGAALEAHIDTSVDPHGENMQISESLLVGSGSVLLEFVPLNSTTAIASGAMLAIGNIAEYNDNDAAIAGGLATGTLYRTGDALKIVW